MPRDHLMEGLEWVRHQTLQRGRWYFSAQDKMTLGPFNWLLFLAFLPLLALQIYTVYSFMGNLGDLSNLLALIKNMLAGSTPEDASFWVKWGAPLLPYALYFLVLPAAVMRLRDMGWQTKWAGVMGLGATLGMLKAVFEIAIPFWPRFLLGCVELFVMTMLTMKGSAKVHQNDGQIDI